MNLWEVIVPLFHPRGHLALTYSKIIAPRYAGRIQVDAKNYPAAAQTVLGEINDRVEGLRKLAGPSEFLARIARFEENPNPVIQFDFGIAHYLIGNIDAAISVLERIQPSRHPQLSYFRAMIPLVLIQLKTNPDILRSIIDGWRSQMVSLLKLERSCGEVEQQAGR